jgi:hypothetical protein
MAGPAKPVSVEDQIAQARQMIGAEYPQLDQGTPQPTGILGRMALPSADGVTNPMTGQVSLNVGNLQGRSTQEIADVLLHELTHRKQVLAKSPLQRVGTFLSDLLPNSEPYHRRPDEIAAYEAEIRRAVGQGRADYTPSFATGQTIEQADIPLRRAAMIKQLKGR